MRHIRICTCGRESVNLYYIDKQLAQKFCPYCGDAYEFIKPPITGVCIATEKTSDSYEYVSLKDFGEALMKSMYDNMDDMEKKTFSRFFKGLLPDAS